MDLSVSPAVGSAAKPVGINPISMMIANSIAKLFLIVKILLFMGGHLFRHNECVAIIYYPISREPNAVETFEM
jgi:hypothetical protein